MSTSAWGTFSGQGYLASIELIEAPWRRLTEERAGGAKSVFHFDVQGSVAKSTHAGIPWLRFIRQRLGAARAFLAVRRLGHSGRALGHRRGLSGAVVARLRQRGPHRRPARRLQHRRLAFARRPRRQPCGVPQPRSFAARTHAGAGGGLDIGRSRLDPRRQRRDDSAASAACDPSVFRLH